LNIFKKHDHEEEDPKETKNMKNLKDIYSLLALYNRQANSEMIDVVSKLTGRARRRDTGSWFGSLHGLLNHLIIADIQWLNRFKPVFPEAPVLKDPHLSPPGISWHQDLYEDFAGLAEGRAVVDGLIIAWFEECPEDRYGVTFQYADSVGTLRTAVAGRAFVYLFVHQTHHRGQVSQILDSLGLPNNFADNGPFLEGLAP